MESSTRIPIPASADSGATLIGDVIHSRVHPDQVLLLGTLQVLLDRVNEVLPARQPLAMTAGDGFQGFFATLEAALRATTLLRLACPPDTDLRFGLGWGEIVIADAKQVPVGQSGPAWWRARDAIEHVANRASKHRWPRSLRTWFVGDDASHTAAINAFLVCRDQIFARMDARDLRIAWGLFVSERQVATAEALDMTQPQVSKQQNENGPAALYQAHRILEGGSHGDVTP